MNKEYIDRYHDDPQFHAAVEAMVAWVAKGFIDQDELSAGVEIALEKIRVMPAHMKAERMTYQEREQLKAKSLADILNSSKGIYG